MVEKFHRDFARGFRHGTCWVFEAARTMMELGFAQLGLRRSFLECDPRNRAAIRLAEKLGMKREGHLREHAFIKGEWCDTLYFGMLVSDRT